MLVGIFGMFAFVTILSGGNSINTAAYTPVYSTSKDATYTKPVNVAAREDFSIVQQPVTYPDYIQRVLSQFDVYQKLHENVVNEFNKPYANTTPYISSRSRSLKDFYISKARVLIVLMNTIVENLKQTVELITASFPSILRDCPAAQPLINSYSTQVILNVRSQYIQQAIILQQQIINSPNSPNHKAILDNVQRVESNLWHIFKNAPEERYRNIVSLCYPAP